MSFFRRVFSRPHPENVTKSIRCTQDMWNALESLAKKQGETPNSYIVLVLDQYLQTRVEAGELDAPVTVSNGKSAS